ncbi:PKD domain-containing protein [Cryobacterium sp. N19]|uniref:PKD domain-containing protein n=1 Tax=Cryobacterium sp. N19 TaxID=2048288 RepID=UPI001E53E3F4|nr:PKD domain-containing protein [Cryobacterium sp. N19]
MATPVFVLPRRSVADNPSPRLARLARAGWVGLATVVAVVAAVLSAPSVALADSAPADAATPVTVSADSLPTTQINGVVWAQLIVGDTVYVGGEFTRSRPAGSARGVNEVVRNNLLAYNLTTGKLITSFNPNVNGAVRALVASADGTRVYAGGGFTKVGSETRFRLAAFDTGTGALVSSWKPVVNAQVKALGIFGNTVYAGGTFTVASGQSRTMTASFATSNGALGTWTGQPDGGAVNAQYAWAWGDGTTERAATATATHTYPGAGMYEVVLTVTDTAGATASDTQTIVATDPPAPPITAFAGDAFGRTITRGLGSADIAGPWTTTGSTANYSVGDGVGKLQAAAGQTVNAYLPGATSVDTDLTVSMGTQQAVTGGGTYLSAIGHRVEGNDYRARAKLLASGAVQVQLMRGATSLKYLTVPGLSYAAGDQLKLRLQVTGTSPTTLKAMVWKLGDAVPEAWQVSATDSTAALQQAGSIGLAFYVSASATLSPMTATFDDLIAEPSH